eukprot:9481119-Pyramimonas_sp.AAC.1
MALRRPTWASPTTRSPASRGGAPVGQCHRSPRLVRPRAVQGDKSRGIPDARRREEDFGRRRRENCSSGLKIRYHLEDLSQRVRRGDHECCGRFRSRHNGTVHRDGAVKLPSERRLVFNVTGYRELVEAELYDETAAANISRLPLSWCPTQHVLADVPTKRVD